jgi:hypothetical protein
VSAIAAVPNVITVFHNGLFQTSSGPNTNGPTRTVRRSLTAWHAIAMGCIRQSPRPPRAAIANFVNSFTGACLLMTRLPIGRMTQMG